VSNADQWQFQQVVVPTSSTVLSGIGEAAPLLVEQGSIPPGSDAGEGLIGWGLIVTGPYLKIQYAVPADTLDASGNPEFTFWGVVRVVRKMGEFCRRYEDVAEGRAEEIKTQSISVNPLVTARDTYHPQYAFLDEDLDPKVIWYYTVFFRNSVTGEYDYSSMYGFARNWAYPNGVTSQHGEELFSLMPEYARRQDENNGGVLASVCNSIGRILDSFRYRVDMQFETGYDPHRVDAALLPYIDQLIGWPTNFELPENLRRRETANATRLFQSKGSLTGIEDLIENVLGWSATLVYGVNHVLHSFGQFELLDPTSPPADWNPATDGDWYSLVVNLAPMFLYDDTDPLMDPSVSPVETHTSLSPSDDTEEWQTPFGVYVALHAPVGDKSVGALVVVQKVQKILAYFFPFYVHVHVALSPLPSSAGFGVEEFGISEFGV